jgi:hypothetical protein
VSVRGAAFLGIGAMVGAGIFALLGEAGAVAGSAVWLSFLLAGIVSALLGYTAVLVLSQHVQTCHALELVSAGGGFGYLLKDGVLDVNDFLDAARRVCDGGSPDLRPGQARAALDAFSRWLHRPNFAETVVRRDTGTASLWGERMSLPLVHGVAGRCNVPPSTGPVSAATFHPNRMIVVGPLRLVGCRCGEAA